MATLFVIRHGQASFLSDNYDRLSELGRRQSRMLGEYWAARGARFDEVYTGPKRRQIDTAALAGEAYLAAGVDWPEPVEIPEFDEYDAETVMRQAMPNLIENSAEIRKLQQTFQAAEDHAEQLRTFQRLYEAVILRWIKGELPLKGVEPWEAFCARVHDGLDRVMQANKGRKRIAVFTSGGPIAITMQRALETSHATTLQLAWMVRNGSVSEFLFSGSRFTLSAFNALAHLDDPELHTYR